MTWLNPRIVRKGAVTSIERRQHQHLLTDFHAITFRIGHEWFRYPAPMLPIIDGDRVVVVGGKVKSDIADNFVVLPYESKLMRLFHGWLLFVFGAVAIVIARGLLANLLWLLEVLTVEIGSSLIFNAIAWHEGYHLAGRYLPPNSMNEARKP